MLVYLSIMVLRIYVLVHASAGDGPVALPGRCIPFGNGDVKYGVYKGNVYKGIPKVQNILYLSFT